MANASQARVIVPPTGYDPLIAQWVWCLEDTRRRTIAALEGVGAAALEWTPPEGGNSIGALLYHLVAIEMSYLYEDMLEQGWAPELDGLLPYDIRDEQGLLAAVRGEELDIHLGRLTRSRALLLQALRTLTPEELRRPRSVEDYTITPEWALHHLMQHEAEHRGQIGELRLRAERSAH